MDSARSAWRLWLLAASGGLVATIIALGAAVAASTATAPAAVLATCWQLFVPRLTARSVTVLVLGALSSAVLIAAAASVIRQTWASRRLARRQKVAEELVVDGEAVRLIMDSRPLAFTQGSMRPRAHLSTGARDRLTAEQLRAVVAHERHHRRRRDPLRLMAARALGDALFFVPAARAVAAGYARLVELEADAAAVAATRTARPLAGALLVFAGSGPVAGAGIAGERVDALVGRRVRFGLPLGLLGAGLAASLTIVAAAVLVGLGAPDHDAARLPSVVEQACILARALLPLGAGAVFLALAALVRGRSERAR